MIKIEYRLLGSKSNPVFVKVFETEQELDTWFSHQVNILIVSRESTGAAAFDRLFG